ncbi:hypothetical protein K2X05_01810 [bacterium]|nr:hypothetical protein [bacterium]
MKYVLVLISILFLSFNVLAKSPGKTQGKSKANISAKKMKIQFDPDVYYKLSPGKRSEYLQIFIDLSAKLEQLNAKKDRKSAMHFFYNELQDILFPKADADTNGVCLNGGIFFEYTGACPTEIPEAYRFSSLAPYYSCGLNQRCAAYFGVDSSGQGFCYTNSSGATADCKSKSEAAGGKAELQKLLASCAPTSSGATVASVTATANAKCSAFRDSMARDSANMARYCISDNSTTPWCQAAQESFNAVTSTAAASAGSTAVVPASEIGRGCTQAEVESINSTLPKKQLQIGPNSTVDLSKKVDPLWHQLLVIGSSGGCSGGISYDNMLRRVGRCQSPMASDIDVEAEKRNNDALNDAINMLTSGQEIKNGDQLREFRDFFGISPTEFKSFFCASSTSGAMTAFGNRLMKESSPGGSSDYKARRNRFKSCVSSSVKLEANSAGEQVWRSNMSNNTCSFRPAVIPNIFSLITNPERYRGKIYFSEKGSMNCFGFESARADGAARATPGTVAENVPSFVQLAPLPGSSYRGQSISTTALNEKFTAYELSCSPSPDERLCGIDNNYCRDSATAN